MHLLSTMKKLILSQSAYRLPTVLSERSIKRWVAPTLRELCKRSKKSGSQNTELRSNFIEWNYDSEIFAFGKRLNEVFKLPVLQTAFTSRSYILQEEKRQRNLGVEESDIIMSDNRQLAEIGHQLTKDYVRSYVQFSLPKVPKEGQQAILGYLLSQATLAHVATHLGVKHLVISAEHPPSEETMANTFLAIVGALHQSSGIERAFIFVRDFVCTQLNQCDLLALCNIENPDDLLKKICRERQMPEPEPRLIGDCAKNTVMAANKVGIYINKQMIGKGYGENVDTAIQTASLDALQSIFGIRDNMMPLNFKLKIELEKMNIAGRE